MEAEAQALDTAGQLNASKHLSLKNMSRTEIFEYAHRAHQVASLVEKKGKRIREATREVAEAQHELNELTRIDNQIRAQDNSQRTADSISRREIFVRNHADAKRKQEDQPFTQTGEQNIHYERALQQRRLEAIRNYYQGRYTQIKEGYGLIFGLFWFALMWSFFIPIEGWLANLLTFIKHQISLFRTILVPRLAAINKGKTEAQVKRRFWKHMANLHTEGPFPRLSFRDKAERNEMIMYTMQWFILMLLALLVMLAIIVPVLIQLAPLLFVDAIRSYVIDWWNNVATSL